MEKSIDGMLVIWTRDFRMEDTEESTELWRLRMKQLFRLTPSWPELRSDRTEVRILSCQLAELFSSSQKMFSHKKVKLVQFKLKFVLSAPHWSAPKTLHLKSSAVVILKPESKKIFFTTTGAASGGVLSLWISCLYVAFTSPLHKSIYFFKLANPGLFFVHFRSFQTNNPIFRKKCPSSIQCRDSNPRLESLPITTRPGLVARAI